MTRKLPVLFVALALALPSIAACGKAVGETIDDATITTRVKTVLINEPAIDAARIDVDTFKGVVTLSGRVKSKDAETKAIALARSIRGVVSVKSALQIQPDTSPGRLPLFD
jgi:osmotically-inducible protein OsmY